MPTYWITGSLTYNVKVEVKADSPEQALGLAEADDWESIVEEGRWKDAYNFTALDGKASVEEVGEDDESGPGDDEKCYSCEEPFPNKYEAVELECGKGWCHRGDCLNDHIGGCGLCPIGLGDDD